MHLFNEPFSPPEHSPEPEVKHVLHKAKDVRCVRFWLSPPPEETIKESMATRQNPRRTVRDKQEILPTAPKEEEWKFNSAKFWGKEHLTTLGVKFNHKRRRMDLNSVLQVNESEWSLEAQSRVNSGVEQLRAVDMNLLKTGEIDLETIFPDGSRFEPMYTSLLDVMSTQQPNQSIDQPSQSCSVAPASSGSTVTSQKRAPPSPISSIPQKRARQNDALPSLTPEPKTPDQPTRPANPNDSGSTRESGDEEVTKMLLRQFMVGVLSVLGSNFTRITWQRSGHKVELVQTYRDITKFRLGIENVTAINDGGLGIRVHLRESINDFKPDGSIRPVLGCETKRRRSTKRNDINLVYEYAGQIFCEMLGQTCHKEFYENTHIGYQEAFVIHCSHSSVTIYYAKLPNAYLSQITSLGKRYLVDTTLTGDSKFVNLERTRKFRMRNTMDRIELFKLLSKLLWYLISGRSHAGYMFNHAGNPMHFIGRPLRDTIQLQTQDDNVARSAPRDEIPVDDEAEVAYEGVDHDEGEGGHSFTESEIDDGMLGAMIDDEDALMILD